MQQCINRTNGLTIRILLTSAGFFKGSLSALVKRRPYFALLLLITIALFLPLLGGLFASVAIILSWAITSATATTLLFVPLVLLICAVSFGAWLLAVGITFVYRRTLGNTKLVSRFRARRERKTAGRRVPAKTMRAADHSYEFESMLPQAGDVWPEIAAMEPLFRPLSKPFDPVTEILSTSNNPHAQSLPLNSVPPDRGDILN